jgi:hypothetical protein
MPKQIPDEVSNDKPQKKSVAMKRTRPVQVPVNEDPNVLFKFQAKCEIPLPMAPADSPENDRCIRWLGSRETYDVRRNQHHSESLIKMNGAPIFWWKGSKYSARNMAYALGRRDFGVLNRSKNHHVRLSSDCGNPYCINPWHHRKLPHSETKRKKQLAITENDNVLMADATPFLDEES